MVCQIYKINMCSINRERNWRTQWNFRETTTNIDGVSTKRRVEHQVVGFNVAQAVKCGWLS